MPAITRLPSFSWGMNTTTSPNQIRRNQSWLLRNLTTKWNRVVTLPGFLSMIEGDEKGRGQWGNSDWQKHAYIHNNNLYCYDEVNICADNTCGSSSLHRYDNAVGVWLDGTKSTDEDYNVLIYKDWIIVTNSLKSWESLLNCIWEPPRVFKCTEDGIVEEPILWMGDNYAPTTSIVYNGRLYFWGGPEWAEYRNYVSWGWRELPDESVWDITTSVSYLFDFVKSLDSATGIIPNYSPGWDIVGDDDPITSFFVNRDDFYIGKRNSIHRGTIQIRTTGDVYESTYLDTTKYTNTGVQSQDVVQDVHDSTYYYDGTHIRKLRNELSDSEYDLFISRPIQSFMECLPKKQNYSSSLFSYPYYKLFLRTDPNSRMNEVWIVINVEDESFSIQDNISVYHTWSAYDRQSSKWWGFWQGYFDNRVIKDNIGNTWDWYERDFEYIWPWMDFGDAVRSKTLLDIHYQITLSDDVNLEHTTLVFRENPSDWCMISQECNYRCIKWCKEEVRERAKGTGNYGWYSYWAYKVDWCWDMQTKILKFPMRFDWQYFQERLLWRWTWAFSLEYVDFLYNLNSR